MEIVIRTAEQVVEKNRSAQTAVITILPHYFNNVKQKHAFFCVFLENLHIFYTRLPLTEKFSFLFDYFVYARDIGG